MKKSNSSFMLKSEIIRPKEEVLLLGWGVPLPLPARRGSRRYDEAFWKELLGGGGKKSEAQNLKELGFRIRLSAVRAFCSKMRAFNPLQAMNRLYNIVTSQADL